MFNKKQKAQMFVTLIVFGLAALIFIFAAPMLAEIIGVSTTGQGTATAFVMKAFIWGIGLIILGVFFKIISSGGSFI